MIPLVDFSLGRTTLLKSGGGGYIQTIRDKDTVKASSQTLKNTPENGNLIDWCWRQMNT